MDFTRSLRYTTTVETLMAVLTNEEFVKNRFQALGATADVTVHTDPTSGSITFQTTAAIPSMKLPSAVRGFFPPELKLGLLEKYTPVVDGTWSVHTQASLATPPVELVVESRITEEEAHAVRAASGSITIKVPFFGKKAEAMAVENIDHIAAAEIESVKRWLASHPTG